MVHNYIHKTGNYMYRVQGHSNTHLHILLL
jgi:hypothetical protein